MRQTSSRTGTLRLPLDTKSSHCVLGQLTPIPPFFRSGSCPSLSPLPFVWVAAAGRAPGNRAWHGMEWHAVASRSHRRRPLSMCSISGLRVAKSTQRNATKPALPEDSRFTATTDGRLTPMSFSYSKTKPPSRGGQPVRSGQTTP